MSKASHGIYPSSSYHSHAPWTKSQAFPIQVFQYAHLSLLGPPAPALPALRNPTVPSSLAMSLWTPQMHSETLTSQPIGFSLSVSLGNTPHLTATCSSFFPSVAPGHVGPCNSALAASFPSEDQDSSSLPLNSICRDFAGRCLILLQ